MKPNGGRGISCIAGVTAPGESFVALEEHQESGELRVVVVTGGERTIQVGTILDQWGSWIIMDEQEPLVVGQEDGTRAFLPAYIAALTELQARLGGEG